jgi:hypothetical protein
MILYVIYIYLLWEKMMKKRFDNSNFLFSILDNLSGKQ